MTTHILDTNVLIRFFLKDNPSQYEIAENLFKKARRGKVVIIIPQIVIFEVQFTLGKFYRFKKEELISTMESLLSAEYFIIESQELFIQALRLFKVKAGLSFVDCFLLAKSQAEGSKVFTFDQQLSKTLTK